MATVIITGANRGIGLELCRQFQERGDTVIAACRNSSEALDKLGVRVEAGVDVCSAQAVSLFVEILSGQKIDILVNCAGTLEGNTLNSLDFDSIRRQFEVNSIGPLRISAALLPRLSAGSKIAIITSRMGSIADNDSGGQYGYRMSKTAINMAAKSLSIDLAPKNIAVGLFHPGFVRTEMTGGNGLINADESAAGLIQRIDDLSMENTGSFYHANGEPLPW
ncbi:MAG: SDR family oxidoreductase [Kofleriaceae bacterium]|nr:SDR family oxidoreductase [Kofleriaceae bacterium]